MGVIPFCTESPNGRQNNQQVTTTMDYTSLKCQSLCQSLCQSVSHYCLIIVSLLCQSVCHYCVIIV